MNQNEEEEEMTEEPKPTATEETMKPPLWPKIGAIVICAILIVAGFAYLLIKLDELERKINEQDGTSDTVNDLIMEINQLRNDVLVLQNDLANLSEEYEYINSTVSGLSDLTTDIWILQNEVTSIQSELQRLSVDIENNTGNISSIQNEVNMLISSMNSV
ncbi:MAG: hypothetical protein ACE5IO_10350, partial [Thermoplasmata archaeon]